MVDSLLGFAEVFNPKQCNLCWYRSKSQAEKGIDGVVMLAFFQMLSTKLHPGNTPEI